MLKLLIRASAAMSLAVAGAILVSPFSADAAHASRPPSLAKMCGGSTMKITCATGSAQCKKTTLSLVTSDGTKSNPATPKGLDEYTAVGLACTSSKDGAAYFLVEYGERPRGCEFCEWHAAYDVSGRLLTNNDPPILHDDELPPLQQDYPNNNELNALFEKLGLKRASTDYLP
jgi:hypothetical protein